MNRRRFLSGAGAVVAAASLPAAAAPAREYACGGIIPQGRYFLIGESCSEFIMPAIRRDALWKAFVEKLHGEFPR